MSNVSFFGFDRPFGLAIDPQDNLFVADYGNNRICMLTTEGEKHVIVGKGRQNYGFANGELARALFNGPRGMVFEPSGNLIIADARNNRIRKITLDGMVSTVAGGDQAGHKDAKGFAARFTYPCSVALDSAGNIFVADTDNKCIRKITPDGEVTTVLR